jgi:hypothetical protein
MENRKPNSAQVGPLSPPPTCARARAPSLPLSLAAPWARLVGVVLSHARPLLSLSRRPHLSARPQPPAHDPPPWTRPRPRDLRPPPHVPTSFEPRALLAHLPPLTCALSRTLSPSLAPRARLESFATAHRRLSAVLRPSSSPRPACCLGELRLAVNYSGHSLVCLVRAHRSVSCATGAPLLSTRSLIAPPPFSKRTGLCT